MANVAAVQWDHEKPKVRLKEQESRLTKEQYAQLLAESGADEAVLRGLLEKGTRSGAMQAEIARLNEEIRALGAVNLAALEELQTAQERKQYLDAQSQDLTEAMATLEDAIRRIDRETRERPAQGRTGCCAGGGGEAHC